MKKNYLKNEKSYYLQQHASNPINWFPWGEKAIEKAKKENKIIRKNNRKKICRKIKKIYYCKKIY